MSTGILPIIKQAAIDAVDATNPVKVVFGTVIKASPVQIKLDSSLTLSEDAGHLILTRSVTEDALKVGEVVLLLKMQGGQSYVVLDRMGAIR